MLNRKRKTREPCDGCALHKSLCICGMMPSLNLSTCVSLVVHHRELKRTTNTGRLALRVLRNSSMHIRGLREVGRNNIDRNTGEHKALDLSCLLEGGYQPLLFYPSDDAVELTSEYVAHLRASSRHDDGSARPIRLIVPDGNWRQASKVAIRHPELAGVPRVILKGFGPLSSGGLSSTAVMRTETKPEGMATLEAIAHALRVIEGEEVYKALIGVYHAKLSATLAGRGRGQLPLDSQVVR